MQRLKLTEEKSVSISPPYSPTVSPQQSGSLPAGQDVHTLQEGAQTRIEAEVTESEPLFTSTASRLEAGTQVEPVDRTLARLQRQYHVVSTLNGLFVNVSLNTCLWLLLGIWLQKILGPYSLGIAALFFVLALASARRKRRAQRMQDALTRWLAQSNDRRVVGALTRALGMRELRGIILDALNRLLPLQSEDPRDVGPLIEMLPWLESFFAYDLVLRADILATLERLIPGMSRADADRLDENQRNGLNHYLGRSRFTLREGDDPASFVLHLKEFFGFRQVSLRSDEKDLTLAILRAYPVIGDGTELPHVRNVAQGRGNAGTDADVRQAAQEYLDLVEQRKQQEKLSTTLLRASSSAEIGSDTLLRPTDGTSATAPNELLRVATGESGSK